MSQTLQRPLTFDARGFERAYSSSLYEPYPICENLSPAEVARFEENYSDKNAVDLDVLTTRLYPLGTIASSVLGYVQKDDSSMEGEEAYFNYRLPDFKGVIGIEGGFDKATFTGVPAWNRCWSTTRVFARTRTPASNRNRETTFG